MLQGWKTVIVNCGVTVFGTLMATDWTSVDPKHAGMIVAMMGAANLVLRAFTSTPIFGGAPAAPPAAK